MTKVIKVIMTPRQKMEVEWRAEVGFSLGGKSLQSWRSLRGPIEDGKSPDEKWGD